MSGLGAESDDQGGPSVSKDDKKKSGTRGKIAEMGKQLNKESVDRLNDISRDELDRVGNYKRGGKIRKSGVAKLHKREQVKGRKKKARGGRR